MKALILNDEVVETGVSLAKLRARYGSNVSFPADPERWNVVTFPDGATCADVVTEEKPSADGYTSTKAAPVIEDGVPVIKWVSAPMDVSEYRQTLKARLAEIRYNKETGHPTLDTSRKTQERFNQIYAAIQRDPTLTVKFKRPDGSFQPLDAIATESIVGQMVAWIQACFDNESDLVDALDAATTIEQLAAVDLTSGWPVA